MDWYDAQGRSLPWRIRPEDREAGAVADPYAVWLSEIMLQQTTVPHAMPYWEKFLTHFPTVQDLAFAEQDEVMRLWAGLGYYARARNLHKCAQVVTEDFGGTFPQTEAELLKLPGIGPYTAAAIAAICFGEATTVVDGNVERVISRLHAIKTPLPKSKTEIREKAESLTEPDRPADYAQAIMDLGATVCRPKNPDCEICPWQFGCSAYAQGEPLKYPIKLKKAKQPIRKGAAFVLTQKDKVLLRRRPQAGLLGGMMEFPGSVWREGKVDEADWLNSAPRQHNWEKLDGVVTHVFTHFKLELTVFTAQGAFEGEAYDIAQMSELALPTVMKKVAKHAGLMD